MPFYVVTLQGSLTIRVVAEYEEEAINKAYERAAYETIDPADYVVVDIEEEFDD